MLSVGIWVKNMSSSVISKLKTYFKPLEKTIFHPQWLSYRGEVLEDWLAAINDGSIVVDVGCADRWPEKSLSKKSRYIGLDHFETATKMYGSRVDVYANAENLPFSNCSIDTVLMFDVLEHIGDGERALKEIFRVLKSEGSVLIQVPFMYPIHDAPYDFRRPTKYGIEELAERNGFFVECFGSRGKPIETACLLINIAMAKSLLNGMGKYAPVAVLFLPIVWGLSILFNCVGWVASKVLSGDELMPFSYHFILKKKESS